MPKILLAASSEPRSILERVLHGHEFVYADTMAQARDLLSDSPAVDQIVCTVLFDESRMFDLLRLAKSIPAWQDVPFVCARMRANVIDYPVALEGLQYACKAMGAAAFIDASNYSSNCDQQMRKDIELFIQTK